MCSRTDAVYIHPLFKTAPHLSQPNTVQRITSEHTECVIEGNLILAMYNVLF